MPCVETAEVSSRPGRGHTDSVMYTNDHPQAGQWAQLFQAKPSQSGLPCPPEPGRESAGLWRGSTVCVMYTTSALCAPCRARDGHRSRVRGGGCSTRLLQHLQWHQAGPARRGRVLGEPQCEETDPARVTRCWPVLCCPTPSCCCSPPWGKRVGNEAWIKL